jgi:hypothetical protein
MAPAGADSLRPERLSFEPHDRRWVRAVTVGVDDAWHGMALPSQRFGSGSALLRPRPAWPRTYWFLKLGTRWLPSMAAGGHVARLGNCAEG